VPVDAAAPALAQVDAFDAVDAAAALIPMKATRPPATPARR